MKSCLSLIVVLLLGFLVFQMYRRSQQPEKVETQGTGSPDYISSILSTIDPYLAQRPEIQRVSLDGSVLDLHYSQDQDVEVFRTDASTIAEVFSRKKQELTNDSRVTVRCIFDSLIRLEARAENGRVLNIVET